MSVIAPVGRPVKRREIFVIPSKRDDDEKRLDFARLHQPPSHIPRAIPLTNTIGKNILQPPKIEERIIVRYAREQLSFHGCTTWAQVARATCLLNAVIARVSYGRHDGIVNSKIIILAQLRIGKKKAKNHPLRGTERTRDEKPPSERRD